MGRYGRSFHAKILTRVSLTIVIPAFLLLVACYVAWNAYVRARIAQEVARTTNAVAERIESDIAAYDEILESLAANPAVRRFFLDAGARADATAVFQGVYPRMNNRRVKAILRGVGADGRRSFSSYGRPDAAPGEEIDPDWGFFGVMNDARGRVTGYRRSLRFGRALQTEYSLGVSMAGENGKTAGYLMADLSFKDAQSPLSDKANAVTVALVLTDEFDRIVAAYADVSDDVFGRFFLPAGGGEIEISGLKYAYARAELPRHRLQAYGLASLQFIVSSFRFGLVTICVIIALFSAVFALILARSVRRLTRPIAEILSVMRKVSRGDFSARLEVSSGDELEEIAASLNSLVVEMESTVKKLMEGIEQAKTAEIKQLQAQFNPHFLYNSLDSAKWMMKMGEADKASRVLTNLAKVLRYSIHDRPEEPLASVEEDLAAMKTYLEIHQLCMGERLDVQYDVEEGILACRVPRLLIQPIVENAVLHGLPAVGRGWIGISIRGQDGLVVVAVSDNGGGFSSAPDMKLSMGMGLVRRRGRLCYGERFSLEVAGRAGGGSTVTLSFPKNTGGTQCSG